LLLALDTSTEMGSAALLEGESLRGEILFHSRRAHSARLMPVVAALLRDAEIEIGELDAVAVTGGPGSFTGVRVGMTTAKMLAYVNGLPIYTAGTLEVLAMNVPLVTGLVVPLLDARKREVFTAAYRHEAGALVAVAEARACAPGRWAELLAEELASEGRVIMLGNGLQRHAGVFEELLGDRLLVAPPALWTPRAAMLGALVAARLSEGDPFRPRDGVSEYAEIVPCYCRRSEAEIGWRERTGQSFVPPKAELEER
jgi:tRNA threonylcarbamoyladenosine biosynthesis protein TsaB